MAGPDILAGVAVADEGDYATQQLIDQTDEWFCNGGTWTVGSAGDADGLQVYCGQTGGTGTSVNITMILADASGNILGTTAEASWASEQWVEADFTGSDVAVTASQEVQLWYALDGGYDYMRTDGGSFAGVNDTSGSYASPPDPLDNTANYPGEGITGIRLMGTIGGAGGGARPVPHKLHSARMNH